VPSPEAFFAACTDGDLAALRSALAATPDLARARTAEGATALHLAVAHPGAVRLLLDSGADPNARDTGDHALPLHFAAGGGHVESVRLLLDAGSDVHGAGDAHALAVIGWATVFGPPNREVVDLLVARGAQHHVFSAIGLEDAELLRQVVAEDPAALARRLSRHEGEQTALHYVVAPPDGLAGGIFRTGAHHRILDALIELGADLDARDAKGRTALELAMLRNDGEAMRRLHAAGARLPDLPGDPASPVPAAASELTPMLAVADMDASFAWYSAVGFTLAASHGQGGRLDWAALRFGNVELMLVPAPSGVTIGPGVSLWIRTDRLDEIYAGLKARQMAHARAVLAGEPDPGPAIPFTCDLYTAFYGQREFCLRDPDGMEVYFCQAIT